jgi:hypothetical protein
MTTCVRTSSIRGRFAADSDRIREYRRKSPTYSHVIREFRRELRATCVKNWDTDGAPLNPPPKARVK